MEIQRAKIPALDKGFVRLVDHMGDDLSIVRAARISYDAAWRAGENEGSDHRLIRYLLVNSHTSPFEAVEFQFEVKAPIFVIRQWHRHRTWSYNELSGRYRELNGEFYIPSVESVGVQSRSNKQGRDITEGESRLIPSMIWHACSLAVEAYKHLLNEGCPRELARTVLPLSIYSHMFAKVNLHNLFHFLTLRLDDHAQWEIHEYAKALLQLIEPVVPVRVAIWTELRANRSK